MNFNAFPSGQERKRVVKENKDSINNLLANNKDLKPGYHWVNSPLDDYAYDDFVSDFEGSPFLESFEKVLPEGEMEIGKYVERTLWKREGEAVGLEFGGPGSRAFAGFSPGFFAKSVGVTLLDHRKLSSIKASLKKDKEINHEVMLGDIFSDNTYELLDKKLNGAKVDFIVSRMAGGLEFVPVEPYTVSKILETWYSLLAENGIMFVQTPTAFNHLLETWAVKITKEYKKVLEIQYLLGRNDAETNCSSFRLRKLPGAPNSLPLLDPKSVRNFYPHDKNL